MQICSRTTAKTWNETPAASERSCLQSAFYNALVSGQTDFFASIYIPVKIPTASGQPENWTWQNVGISAPDIADIYADFYGCNYIVEPLKTSTGEPWDFSRAVGKLAHRIKSVLNINKAKYLKLIELNGYTYNPLWNVDGEEIYTSLENSGTVDETTTRGEDRTTWNNVETINQTDIWTYEGGESPNPAQRTTTTAEPDEDASGNPTKNYTRSRAEPEDNTTEKTYTHNNADNNGEEYAVQASDTAFGQAATGGDHYHTDKRIRRGNIGVTASQDLIDKQRAIIRGSIIQEFFEDINTQILIGIFDF